MLPRSQMILSREYNLSKPHDRTREKSSGVLIPISKVLQRLSPLQCPRCRGGTPPGLRLPTEACIDACGAQITLHMCSWTPTGVSRGRAHGESKALHDSQCQIMRPHLGFKAARIPVGQPRDVYGASMELSIHMCKDTLPYTPGYISM